MSPCPPKDLRPCSSRVLCYWDSRTTLCLEKVPTFELSVTLSNINWFSKFLHCWKAYEICYKIYTTIPTHLPLGMLLHYLGKLKIQIYCSIWENRENVNTCTDFNSCARVTVYAECIYVLLSKSCPRCWIPCWSLTNIAVMSAVTNFRCHKLIAKVNK